MITTIVQLTDTHLLASPTEHLRGFSTWHSLQAVLSAVKLLNPDLLLLTGDLAEAGDRAAYEQLRTLLNPMDWPTIPPTYWLPGNHDHLATMSTMLNLPPFHTQPIVEIGGWRLILLDSTKSEHPFGAGTLPATTLDWLQTELQTHRHFPTLIALHHHPIHTGIDWLDEIGLENADTFQMLLAQFPQVKLVLFGHIHLALHQQQSGIHYYGCPSTCTQVIPLDQTAQPACQQPGFRWLRLYPDGTHTTGVQRVSFSQNSARLLPGKGILFPHSNR